jgi:hypothetical protein
MKDAIFLQSSAPWSAARFISSVSSSGENLLLRTMVFWWSSKLQIPKNGFKKFLDYELFEKCSHFAELG